MKTPVIKITVRSQKGFCSAGHKVGDSWIIDDMKTPGGICLDGFACCMTFLTALKLGAKLPFSGDPDVGEIVCPDEKNPLVFEIRRLRDANEELIYKG